MTDHSYEEIRKVTIEILSGKIKTKYGANHFDQFDLSISEIFQKRSLGNLNRMDG